MLNRTNALNRWWRTFICLGHTFHAGMPQLAAGSFTLPAKLAGGHRPMAIRAQADFEAGQVLFSGRMNFYTRFSYLCFCVELAAQIFYLACYLCHSATALSLTCCFVLFLSFLVTCDNEWQTLYHPSPWVLSALLLTSAVGRDFIWEIKNVGKCHPRASKLICQHVQRGGGGKHVLMTPVLSSIFQIHRINISSWDGRSDQSGVTCNAAYGMRQRQRLCRLYWSLELSLWTVRKHWFPRTYFFFFLFPCIQSAGDWEVGSSVVLPLLTLGVHYCNCFMWLVFVALCSSFFFVVMKVLYSCLHDIIFCFMWIKYILWTSSYWESLLCPPCLLNNIC